MGNRSPNLLYLTPQGPKTLWASMAAQSPKSHPSQSSSGPRDLSGLGLFRALIHPEICTGLGLSVDVVSGLGLTLGLIVGSGLSVGLALGVAFAL
jgi:hypothetical protein